MKIFVASSNPGKAREYAALAAAFGAAARMELDLLPNFAALPSFQESAPTFAENAAGKALHYSRFVEAPVIADDSGLCVDALGGAPGVHSARFAGANATDGQRIEKLLSELREKNALLREQRAAHFVCVLALARQGRALAVVSGRSDGCILEARRGAGGFGYDPVFLCSALDKTFAELSPEEKNLHSHRGKAFRRLLEVI